MDLQLSLNDFTPYQERKQSIWHKLISWFIFTGQNSQIEKRRMRKLWCRASSKKRFCLQILRSRIQSIPKSLKWKCKWLDWCKSLEEGSVGAFYFSTIWKKQSIAIVESQKSLTHLHRRIMNKVDSDNPNLCAEKKQYLMTIEVLIPILIICCTLSMLI